MTDEAWQSRVDFSSFFLDLMGHVDMREVPATESSPDVELSLRSDYDGRRVLDEYARKWEVKAWTPLLLARALVDFKERIGGQARVAAVAPDFIEVSQTRCEFGEPRANAYRGNLCQVCKQVALSIAGASGITSKREMTLSGTIADGYGACRFKAALI